MQGPNRRLFLSYGRQDASDSAALLRHGLRARGFDVWLDTESLRAGSDWQAAIVEALRGSGAVVALLSPHAVRRTLSGQRQVDDSVCLDELSAARWDAQIPIVPAMVQRCEVPFTIARLHHADLTNWRDSAAFEPALDRLAQDIDAALRGETRLRSELDALRPRDDSPYLEDKRRNFEGRAWLFASIDAWLAAPGERALLITGDPGIGKTAILAQIVHREDSRLIGYYCCRADSPASLVPAEFLRTLAALLAARLPDYVARLQDPAITDALADDVAGKDPAGAFDAAILSPLAAMPPPDGGTKYLFVDALDEAFVRDRAGPSIVQVLAPRLESFPPWLRIVLTSRRDREILRQLSGLRARHLDAHGRENQDDLRAYLTRRLGEPALGGCLAAAQLDTAAALKSLLRLADGNFLVARESLQGIERGQYDLSRLDDLPPGIDGIYWRFFTRTFPQPQAYQAGPRKILQAIAVAREPLTRAGLAAATALDSDLLRRHLALLSGYLREENGTLLPWHKSLVDWLTTNDSEFSLSAADGHGRMADACLAALAQDTALSGYALRHAIVHLTAAGRWTEAGDLLADLRYVERRVNAGLVFDLAADYTGVLGSLAGHARFACIRFIGKWVASDPHFLSRHPAELLPCLWNAAAWSTAGPPYYDMREPDAGGTEVLAALHGWKTQRAPAIDWLRALTPPHETDGDAGDSFLRTATVNIRCLAPSPDGRLIASGSGNGNTFQDCVAAVWDVATGRQILAAVDFAAPVAAVAFAPDGQRLALCTEGFGERQNVVCMYFVESGIEQWRNDGLDSPQALAFSPDGTRLACASASLIVVLDAETGSVVERLAGHDGTVRCVAWLPGGQLVSGGRDRTARLWDTARHAPPRVLAGHVKQVSCVAGTPDGRTVVTGAYAYSETPDRTLRIWDVERGVEITKVEDLDDVVLSVSCSPDGRLVCAGMSGQLRIVEIATGKEHTRIEWGSDALTQVAYLRDGRIATCGTGESTIRIRNGSASQRPRLRAHGHPIEDMAFVDDGSRLLTVAWDGLGVWDPGNGAPLEFIDAEEDEVPGVLAVSTRGAFVTLGRRSFIRDATSGQPTTELERGDEMFYRFAAWCAGDSVVVGAEMSYVTLWDGGSGRRIARLRGNWVSGSADDHSLFVSGRHGLAIVDPQTGAERATVELPGAIHSIASHPRLPWVVALTDDTMSMLDWRTGQTLWQVAHPSRPRRALFSDDGTTLVTETHVRDVALYRWDPQTGRQLARCPGVSDLQALAEAASPGDAIRLVSRELELVAEDTRDGVVLASMPGSARRLLRSPDGKTWAMLAGGDVAPSLAVLERGHAARR
ncbi:MAG TPA: TIR domain-containing protein [Albitalea sp.]|nr:TIR domain-containing protein [Albitalea sp.]